MTKIGILCRICPDLLASNVETPAKKADWLQKELNLLGKELTKMVSV